MYMYVQHIAKPFPLLLLHTHTHTHHSLFQSGDALYHKVVTGERSRLVETAYIDFPAKRDPERLSTVDAQFGQRYERGVDSKGELNGQFGRDD